MIDRVPVCSVVTKGWLKLIPGINYKNIEYSTLDSKNNLYIIGKFSYFLDFDPTEGKDIRVSSRNCIKNSCSMACGFNKYCKDDNCECIDGYHKEQGTENCIIDCNLNCEDNQKCVKEGRENLCRCNNGYHYEFGEDGDCVEEQCDFKIKENEYCENNHPVCKEGYTQDISASIFITKFDSSGSYLWTLTFDADSPNDFHIDGDNLLDTDDNLFAIGYFKGKVNIFGSYNFTSVENSTDLFILKYVE